MASSSDALSTAGLMVSVFFKLGIVLLVIYLGVSFLRRFQLHSPGHVLKQIHVLETTHLSPRQKLYLVEVGQQTFLIGATEQSLSYLSEVEPLPAEEALTELPLSLPDEMKKLSARLTSILSPVLPRRS
jgi:flagellar biosynthetic protein FliO